MLDVFPFRFSEALLFSSFTRVELKMRNRNQDLLGCHLFAGLKRIRDYYTMATKECMTLSFNQL